MQTCPGAQVSVCSLWSALMMLQLSSRPFTTVPGCWLQVSAPSVLTEHFTRQPEQPVWQNGSHRPASAPVQLALGSKQGGSPPSPPSPAAPPMPPAPPFPATPASDRWVTQTEPRLG